MTETLRTWHYTYINNVLGAFVRSMGDFFRSEVYPNTQEIVIGTYAKAVQHYKKRREEASEKGLFHYPALSLDPGIYDIEPEERAGKFFHNYPGFNTKFGAEITEPKIYEDDNLWIGAVLNRYKSRMELIVWCRSPYEVIDNRIRAFQYFGGLDRPIRPRGIESYFVLPTDIHYQRYTNRYTNETYVLDWSNSTAKNVLIKNMNKEAFVYPFTLAPYVKLTGVTDGSERYGDSGTDDISEYRITLEMEWECNLPTHLVFFSNELPEAAFVGFEITVGHQYVPATGGTTADEIIDTHITLDSTSQTTVSSTIDLSFDKAYNYIVTSDDEQKITNDEKLVIDLEEPVDDIRKIRVFGRLGRLEADVQYTIENPLQLTIFGFAVDNISEGDLLTVMYYTSESV